MTNRTDCNCSLSIRLCGDGCKKCQPETYIFNLENALQAAEQEIEQLRSEIESIKKVPMFDHATHKIVPINPTYEMVTAWHDSVFNYEDDDENVAKSISNVIASAPEYQESTLPENNSPSNAAIEYALYNHDFEFLHAWFYGNFDAIRTEWPDAPESVFIGADPLYKPPAPKGDKP